LSRSASSFSLPGVVFGAAALGDVPRRGVDQLVLGSRDRVPFQPAPAALLGSIAVHEIDCDLTGRQIRRRALGPRAIVGVHEFHEAARSQLVLAPAERLHPGGVELLEVAVGAGGAGQVARELEVAAGAPALRLHVRLEPGDRDRRRTAPALPSAPRRRRAGGGPARARRTPRRARNAAARRRVRRGPCTSCRPRWRRAAPRARAPPTGMVARRSVRVTASTTAVLGRPPRDDLPGRSSSGLAAAYARERLEPADILEQGRSWCRALRDIAGRVRRLSPTKSTPGAGEARGWRSARYRGPGADAGCGH
jgi:hypothetical protein